jgi:hypothetical protein
MSTKTLSTQNLVLSTGILLSLAASGCCFGGTPTPIDPALLPPITPPTTVPGSATAAPIAPQALTLAPGFAPDPTTLSVVAGGPVSASSMQNGDAFCGGNIAAAANITLTTTGPITGLRILTRSTEDTTLMVRLSDGRVLCDDDGGGYPNSAVQGDFPAGTHQVFVGSFHQGDTPAATIGFTVNAALQNATLP